jgi:ABC-type transport system involved in cytochrome c biogenesis permease subunit
VGFGFLVLGMLMGCVWAKEAWGHYWTWDPKETWAFVTSMAYLAYIHLRLQGDKKEKVALWLIPVAFVLLMITWIGVNYLPSAQGSIHVY